MKNYQNTTTDFNQDYGFETKSKSKSNVFLGSALLWFGYSLLLAFSAALIVAWKITPLVESMYKNPIPFIAWGIITFIVIFITFIFAPRMNFWVLLPLVSFIMISIGSLILGFIIYQLMVEGDYFKMMGILFIPAGIMVLMGILAVFNIITMKRLWIPIVILLVATLVIGLISFFTMSNRMYTLYLILGFVLMCLYMGVDWVLIVKYNRYYRDVVETKESRKEILKFSLFLGFKLAFDYIYAVIYLYQIFGRR